METAAPIILNPDAAAAGVKVWTAGGWIALVAALNVWHGCIAPPPSQVDFAVISHTTEPGSCFRGMDPSSVECHVLVVDVTNLSPNATLGTGQMWHARDYDGGWHAADYARDEQDIAYNETARVTLGIDTPVGTRLVALGWGNDDTRDLRPVNA